MPDNPSGFVSIQDWNYRGEGNANLVISLPSTRSVLRFVKSKYDDKDHDSHNYDIAHYVNSIMRPALTWKYVRPVTVGIVSDTDFESIRLRVRPFRPRKRMKKEIKSKTVIVSPDCVFLTPEYSFETVGDFVAVEIKPKQGWHSVKASCSSDLCLRCLKQYAKLYQGEIDSISSYCPLDLFSGTPSRMKKALFDLYENPQNRFKVFKNGKLIYGSTEAIGDSLFENDLVPFLHVESESEVRNALTSMVLSALLNKEDEGFQDVIPSILKDDADFTQIRRCNTDSVPLPDDCVLSRLLSIQKRSELSDRDAKILCERLLSRTDNLESLNNLILSYDDERGSGLEDVTDRENEEIRQLQRFLMSVTAKDVSIIVTFRRLRTEKDGEDTLPKVTFRGQSFRVMISVIDLDPKPVHRIYHWVKQKEEWLKIYFDSLQETND